MKICDKSGLDKLSSVITHPDAFMEYKLHFDRQPMRILAKMFLVKIRYEDFIPPEKLVILDQ